MFVVIAYDIASDRRRMRAHALLLKYGTAVQQSVFECEIDRAALRHLRARLKAIVHPTHDNVRCELDRAALRHLRARLKAIAHPRHDNIRIYRLCRDCVATIETAIGSQRQPSPPVVVV